MIDDILSETESEMTATIESFKHDVGRIRAGRATPSLLDHVMVDYYGSATALNKIATVTAPEARLLLIQPFDQGSVGAVEKAIRVSDLGLSPMTDGKIIRVPIPELTEERRRDLVKQVGKEAETHRVSARAHRRSANELLKQAALDKEIGEDDARAAQAKIQKVTDDCVASIDTIAKAKEAEVMAV